MKTARDIMTSPVHSVTVSDTVQQVAQALAEHNVGSLPVKAGDGQLAGIITDRDLVVQSVAKGQDPSAVTVGDLTGGEVVSVGPDDDVKTLLDLLGKHQIRRVPVVDNGEVVGMVSQADVARELTNDQTGEVVAEISQQ